MPLPEFVELYREMIRRVRSHGIRPILTNLPPLDSERFFNWWCGDLDKEVVMRWLGDVGNIYVWQERYSRAVERLAREENVPLVDVRGAFLDYGHLEQTLCADGTHPNTVGQGLITKAFQDFGRGLAAGRSDRPNRRTNTAGPKTGPYFLHFLKMWMRKDA